MRHLFTVLLLLALSATANAAILTVHPGGAQDYTTVQAAVTASVANDTILVYPAVYNEHVSTTGENNITIMGAYSDPDSVAATVIATDGTVASTDGYCIFVFNMFGDCFIKNLTVRGDGSSDHVGIAFSDANASLTIDNVIFEGVRECFWMASTTTGSITIKNSVFRDPQTANRGSGANAFTWGGQLYQAGSFLMENCSLDTGGLTGQSWNTMFRLNGVSGGTYTIRNSEFIADGTDLVNGIIYFDNDNTGVVIEGSLFSGNYSASVRAQLRVGTAIAGDNNTNVVIRGNTFTNMPNYAIDTYMLVGTAPPNFHRDIVVVGNKFYGDTVNGETSTGVRFAGVNGGVAYGNDFYNLSETGESGVGILSGRNISVSGNRFYNCDNGAVIAGTNSKATGTIFSYNVSIVGNYFTGTSDDGAIKIDNYNSTTAAAAPSDTLLTIAMNVFDNVTVLGQWVDTANVDVMAYNVAQWDSLMGAKSSLMPMQAEGSVKLPTGVAAARNAALLRTRGLGSGSGLK